MVASAKFGIPKQQVTSVTQESNSNYEEYKKRFEEAKTPEEKLSISIEAQQKQKEELSKLISGKQQRRFGQNINKQKAIIQQSNLARQGINEIEKNLEQTKLELAKVSPEKAEPQYVEQVYGEAKSGVQQKADELQTYIQNQKDDYQKIFDKLAEGGITTGKGGESEELKDARHNMQDAVRIAEAKLGAYQDALKGNKEQFIKDYYSGKTEGLAEFNADKIQALIDRRDARNAREDYLKQQGVRSWDNYSTSIQQDIINKGNFDKNKGIYTYNGLKFAAEQAPIEALRNTEYKSQIYNWGKKIGFEKLPEFAREKLGYKEIKTDINPKDTGEIPIYDTSGKVVAIESEKYGQTIPIRRYYFKEGIDPDTMKPVLTEEEVKGKLNKLAASGGFIGGISASAYKNIKFLKEALTQSPIKTTVEVGKGFYEIGKKALTTGFPEISYLIMNDPSYLVGYASGEYLTMKGIGEIGEISSKGIELGLTYASPKFKPVVELERAKIIRDIPSIKTIEEYEIFKPSEVVNKLQSQGKILFKELSKEEFKEFAIEKNMDSGAIASFYPIEKGSISNAPELEGVIYIRKDLDVNTYSNKLSHELGHFESRKLFQGKGNVEKGIDYYSRESEKYAIEYEKKAKEIGGIKAYKGEKQTTTSIEIAKPLSSPEMKLTSKEQVELAGKEVDAVSAARDFYTLFKKEVEIDKPITEGSPLIEKSLFFDPSGRLRVSRLIEDLKKASFMDYLTEDITFKRPKAQALFLEKTRVERFPRELGIIKEKLSKDIPLSIEEQKKLLEFQLKPSGKLKPIGKLRAEGTPTSEPEVTLAPKEILVKDEVIAKTIYEKTPITIYRTKIKVASEEALKAVENIEKGILKVEDIKILEKETDLDLSYLRNEKYLSPYKPVIYYPKNIHYGKDYYKEPTYKEVGYKEGVYKEPTYKEVGYKEGVYKEPTYKEVGYVPIKYANYQQIKPVIYPNKLIINELGMEEGEELLGEELKKKIYGEESPKGYNVYVKEIKGKQYKKVTTVPLTKQTASDELAYLLDESVARSGFLKPTNQKPKEKILPIPAGYYEATRDKFRNFKVKQGKKIKIGGIIEKTNYALDSQGERNQISAFKLAKQINRQTKYTPTKNSAVDYAMNL